MSTPRKTNSIFEELKGVIRDLDSRVGGAVSNLKGTVVTTADRETSPKAQQWYVLSTTVKEMQDFANLANTISLERPGYTLVTQSGDYASYLPALEDQDKQHLFISTVNVTGQLTLPIKVEAPGYEIAVYVNNSRLKYAKDSLTVTPTLSTGKVVLSVILYGGSNQIDVALPRYITAVPGIVEPGVPQWRNDGVSTYLDPSSASLVNRLEWGNGLFAASWAIYKATGVSLGVPSSVIDNSDGTFEVTYTGQVLDVYIGDRIYDNQLFGADDTEIDHYVGVVTDVTITTNTVFDVLLSEIADTTPANWTNPLIKPGPYTAAASLSYAGENVIRWDDFDVQKENMYFYRATAFDFITTQRESGFSVELPLRAGDTTPPASVTGLSTSTVENTVTATFTTPSDEDFSGVTVYKNATYPYPNSTFQASDKVRGYPNLPIGDEVTIDIEASTTDYYWIVSYDGVGNIPTPTTVQTANAYFSHTAYTEDPTVYSVGAVEAPDQTPVEDIWVTVTTNSLDWTKSIVIVVDYLDSAEGDHSQTFGTVGTPLTSETQIHVMDKDIYDPGGPTQYMDPGDRAKITVTPYSDYNGGGTAGTAVSTVFRYLLDGSGVTQVDEGGTGFDTYSEGDIVYASAATTFSKLARTTGVLKATASSNPTYLSGAPDQYLKMTSAGTDVEFATLSVAAGDVGVGAFVTGTWTMTGTWNAPGTLNATGTFNVDAGDADTYVNIDSGSGTTDYFSGVRVRNNAVDEWRFGKGTSADGDFVIDRWTGSWTNAMTIDSGTGAIAIGLTDGGVVYQNSSGNLVSSSAPANAGALLVAQDTSSWLPQSPTQTGTYYAEWVNGTFGWTNSITASDADTLDGEHGTFYLTPANFNSAGSVALIRSADYVTTPVWEAYTAPTVTGQALVQVAGTNRNVWQSGDLDLQYTTGTLSADEGIELQNETGNPFTGTAGYSTLYANAGGILKLQDGTGTVYTMAVVGHEHAGTDITSGVVGVAYGGTGLASYTTNGLLIANGATSITQVNAPSDGQGNLVLTWDDTLDTIDWAAPTIPSHTLGNHSDVSGIDANDILRRDGTNQNWVGVSLSGLISPSDLGGSTNQGIIRSNTDGNAWEVTGGAGSTGQPLVLVASTAADVWGPGNVDLQYSTGNITESQITDDTILARNAGNETISGAWTFSNSSLTLSNLTQETGPGGTDIGLVMIDTTSGALYESTPADAGVGDSVSRYLVHNSSTGWGWSTIPAGSVTEVTVGTGLGVTNGTTTPNITLALNNLSEKSGNLVAGDRLVLANATGQFAETISGIPLSIFTNDSGWTNNDGTVTTVSVGTGLSISNPSTTPNITLALQNLTDMSEAFVNTDEFLVLDSSVQKRKSAIEIGVSVFNNDAGYTTNSGTVTSVTVGTGLDVSVSSPNPNITLSLDELPVKTGDLVATDVLVGVSTTTMFAEPIQDIPLSIFANDSGFVTSSNAVTITGTQTITGLKTFESILTISSANVANGALNEGIPIQFTNLTEDAVRAEIRGYQGNTTDDDVFGLRFYTHPSSDSVAHDMELILDLGSDGTFTTGGRKAIFYSDVEINGGSTVLNLNGGVLDLNLTNSGVLYQNASGNVTSTTAPANNGAVLMSLDSTSWVPQTPSQTGTWYMEWVNGAFAFTSSITASDADQLDGQHGTFYQTPSNFLGFGTTSIIRSNTTSDAWEVYSAPAALGRALVQVSGATSNVWESGDLDLQYTTGTLASARLSGSYTGITGLGTITSGTWQSSTPIDAAYLDAQLAERNQNESIAGAWTFDGDTLFDGGNFTTSVPRTNILIGAGSGTSGFGSLGGSIAFSSVGSSTLPRAAIVAYQSGADTDQIGLKFYVNPNVTFGDLEESLRLDHNGDVFIDGTNDFTVEGGDFIVEAGQVYLSGVANIVSQAYSVLLADPDSTPANQLHKVAIPSVDGHVLTYSTTNGIQWGPQTGANHTLTGSTHTDVSGSPSSGDVLRYGTSWTPGRVSPTELDSTVIAGSAPVLIRGNDSATRAWEVYTPGNPENGHYGKALVLINGTNADVFGLGNVDWAYLDNIPTGLTQIGALSSTDSNFIVGSAGGWVAETGDTVRASLGLTIGTNVQAYDTLLQEISNLSSAPGSNRILYYDNPSGIMNWLSIGTGLSINDTSHTISVSGLDPTDIDWSVAVPEDIFIEFGGAANPQIGFHNTDSASGEWYMGSNDSGQFFFWENDNSSTVILMTPGATPSTDWAGTVTFDNKVTFDRGTLSGFAPAFARNIEALYDSSLASGNDLAILGTVNQTTATSGGPQGIEGYVVSTHSTGNVNLMIATIGNAEHAGAGTVSELRGFQTTVGTSSTGGVTKATGVHIANAFKTSTGAITTQYGLYVEDQNKGAYNYAIYTGAGEVRFGDTVTFEGPLRGAGIDQYMADYAYKTHYHSADDLYSGTLVGDFAVEGTFTVNGNALGAAITADDVGPGRWDGGTFNMAGNLVIEYPTYFGTLEIQSSQSNVQFRSTYVEVAPTADASRTTGGWSRYIAWNAGGQTAIEEGVIGTYGGDGTVNWMFLSADATRGTNHYNQANAFRIYPTDIYWYDGTATRQIPWETSTSSYTFNGVWTFSASAPTIILSADQPEIRFYETGTVTADERYWRMYANDGVFALLSMSDAGTGTDTIWSITRAGQTPDYSNWNIHDIRYGADGQDEQYHRFYSNSNTGNTTIEMRQSTGSLMKWEIEAPSSGDFYLRNWNFQGSAQDTWLWGDASDGSFEITGNTVTLTGLSGGSGGQVFIKDSQICQDEVPHTTKSTGTTETINWDNGNVQAYRMTVAGNVTFTISTNAQPGATYSLYLYNNSGSTRTYTFTGAATYGGDLTGNSITIQNTRMSILHFQVGRDYNNTANEIHMTRSLDDITYPT